MESKDIFREIRAKRSFFSHVEKKIADSILNQPEHFIQCSIGGLARELEVSQGSVNNFAQKLIGEGFATLKLQVAQQLPKQQTKVFETIEDGDHAKDVLRKTMEQLREAYENTVELNGKETLDKVAEMILHANKIDIYGIFLSGIVAEQLRYQLVQLGISADYVKDSLLSQASVSMLKEDSLVIAVSSSGQTKDIIDAVSIAKERQIPVVALTSDSGSPLAQLADEVLVAASSGTNVSNDMYEKEFSQFLLANAVCAYIRHVRDKNDTKQYYKLMELLNSHSIEG